MADVRKVAAYTHQALLGLAATQLGVPVSKLSVADAIVSGGGKSISYGQLVQGQQLDLKISVTGMRAKVDPSSPEGNGLAGLDGFTMTGDPPTKPVSQYKVIGTSYPMPGIPDKVREDPMDLRRHLARNASCPNGAAFRKVCHKTVGNYQNFQVSIYAASREANQITLWRFCCVHPPSRPGSLRGADGGSSLSDGQYEYAAAAAACAANVPGVAARSLHKHVQVSRTRDQTGRNCDLQLLTADNRGTQGLPVDDNDRRRNKLAAHYGEHSALLHLSKIHRAR
jgi:hypothetical protein